MPTQQDELYAAERLVSKGRQFDTYEELQVFVDELRDTSWWQRDYDMVRRVEVGKADQRVTRGSVGWWEPAMAAGRIEMWTGHMNLQVIAHELSHVLAEAKWGSKSHDPLFARTYANLTYYLRGSEAWLELQRAFDSHGIDYA